MKGERESEAGRYDALVEIFLGILSPKWAPEEDHPLASLFEADVTVIPKSTSTLSARSKPAGRPSGAVAPAGQELVLSEYGSITREVLE